MSKEEPEKEENQDSIGGWFMMAFVSILVIMMVLAYMMFDMNTARVNIITDQMMEEIRIADCSDDFREGWIAALNHFNVLWNSPSNATNFVANNTI